MAYARLRSSLLRVFTLRCLNPECQKDQTRESVHNWRLGDQLHRPVNSNNSTYGRCVLCGHDGLMVIKKSDFLRNVSS